MRLLLGVTGSISAYKAMDIMRTFQKQDHRVSVVLTRSALHFIGPISFETFTPGRVYSEMFAQNQDPLLHINLGKNHDLFLVAPASANIIGKMANGIADDLLSTTFLAFYKPVVLAPAMNSYMLENPAVQDNISRLKERGVAIIEPDEGSLACKDEGKGKLPAPDRIYQFCLDLVSKDV